jgi:hypothetical protein
MASTNKDYSRREIALKGKLITSHDPSVIGENFQSLKNLRYKDTHPIGIAGMTKVNSTALTTYLKTRAAFQFRKEQPAENHLLIQAFNTGLTASQVLQNTTAAPAAGDFSSTALWTDSAGAGTGRFSYAPGGNAAYCNGVDSCVWGGNELTCSSFINFDPNGTFTYDYSEQVKNLLTDAHNIAKCNTTAAGIDAYTMLLLHLDNNVTDVSPTTVHTVTNANVTFSTTYKKFGTHGAVFNGTNAKLTIPDNADFDFSDGTFCIDAQLWAGSLAANNPFYYQKTDITKISFGTGAVEPAVGATINGQTSSATGIVDYVVLDTGAWDGSGTGTIYMHSVTGTWQNAENIRVGTDIKAASTSVASDAGDNYILAQITTTGAVSLVVHECYGSSSDVVSLATGAGEIATGSFYHIDISENGNSWYIFVNGVQKAYVSDTSRAKNYISIVSIGTDNSAFFNGYMDEYRVSSTYRHTTAFLPPQAAYGSTATVNFYLGSVRPLQGFKAYVGTANDTAGTMTVDYWSGTAWTGVSSLVDNTSAGGVSLAATGTVTFTSTDGTAKAREINGTVLYFYKISLSACNAATTIYHVSLDAPFQTVKDVWDGKDREEISFQVYKSSAYSDYTQNVHDNSYNSADTGTYMELDSLATATDYFVLGFEERQMGVKFNLIGGKGNTTANAILTVYYWSGTAWVTVGAIQDGTIENAASFAKSGIVTWNPPDTASEFKTKLAKDVELYCYKFKFSQNLSSDVQLYYAAGISAPIELQSYKFPLMAQDRLWLCSQTTEKKNSVKCSNKYLPHAFNGADSVELFFGDDSEVISGIELYSQYGSSIYNMILFFKKNETWVLAGSDPKDWNAYRISQVVGCVAPNTLCMVNLPTEMMPGLNRNLVVWQGADGIYASDGRAPIPLHFDIENYFDKKKSECITAGYLDKSYAWFDRSLLEYHWVFCSGAAATTCNKEFVLDCRRNKWFEIDRGTGKYLQVGTGIEDVYGNNYTYGFIDSGYAERLEYGTDFDGSDIVCEMQHGDLALAGGSVDTETTIRHIKLVCAAKTVTTNNIAGTHYGGSKTAGTAFILSAANSGYRLAHDDKSVSYGSHVFHSVKLNMTTDNETVGFEPMYLVYQYHVTRDKEAA